MAPDGFASQGREYGRSTALPWAAHALPYVLPEPLLRRGIAAAYADPSALRPEILARYRDMLRAPGIRRAILDRVSQHVLEPPEPFLRRITSPVLLLWGAEDRMVPAEHARDYERVLADSRSAILPGIGHVPMEEDPQQSLAALRAFLDL
jgi:pimeloyl-ACP methyl ester carboxylesterase